MDLRASQLARLEMKSCSEELLYSYRFFVMPDMLDELGHCNYLELKQHLEAARYQLCRFLGFPRKTLRKKLNLGLFMQKDEYEYFHEIKLHDVVAVIPQIKALGTRVSISMELYRVVVDRPRLRYIQQMTTTAKYEMVMVNLTTRKPTRLPRPVIRRIEGFNEVVVSAAKVLWGLNVPPFK